MSTTEDAMDELAKTSSDAGHSTYEEADDLPITNPPMGPQVIQTRGLPDEAAPVRSAPAPKTTAKGS